MRTNHLEIRATVIERSGLRYTPAGIEALDLRLQHQSSQDLGSHPQRVELELQAVAFGAIARALQHLPNGHEIQLQGFLIPSRRGSRTLKLNITAWTEGA